MIIITKNQTLNIFFLSAIAKTLTIENKKIETMKLPFVDSRSIGVTTMTILETKPPIFDNKIMCFQIYSVFIKQFTSE